MNEGDPNPGGDQGTGIGSGPLGGMLLGTGRVQYGMKLCPMCHTPYVIWRYAQRCPLCCPDD